MTADSRGGREGGLRELLVVLVLAFAGLLLATVLAFTPWYAAAAGEGAPPLVDVNSPQVSGGAGR